MSNLAKHKVIFVADYKDAIGKVYIKKVQMDSIPRTDSRVTFSKENRGDTTLKVIGVNHRIKDDGNIKTIVNLKPKKNWGRTITILEDNGFKRVPKILP